MKESSTKKASEEKRAGKAVDGQSEDLKKTDASSDPVKDAEIADTKQSAMTEDASAKEKTDVQKTDEKISTLEKENAELKDQLLRRAADFDNYRKRMLKEKQDVFDYANTNLLQDLLDSLDDFDRTVEAAASATEVKPIADGVKMVSQKLVSMLETKYNLIAYGTAGDSFNPDEHQAIGSVPGPVAEPVLKEVYLKGYKLKDRVIRHAKVMVTMPDSNAKAPGADSTEKAETGKENKAEKAKD